MSFILDALKKAEAERHMGQIPGLHAQPAVALPVAAAPARTRKAVLGAAALLLAAAAVALAWLQPWQERVSPPRDKQPGEAQVSPAAATPAPAAPAIVAPPPGPAQQIVAVMPPASSKPEKRPSEARKPPVRQAPPPQKAPVTEAHSSTAPAVKAVTVANPATAAAASRPQTMQTAQPPSGSGNDADLRPGTALVPEAIAVSLRELPEQIQRELPNLAIGGYVYSENPRERQLLVNKRLLHEGEEAAPGVTLERMMPKAAVFHYKGYRYRVAY